MIKTIISACKKVIFLPKYRGIMRVQGDKKAAYPRQILYKKSYRERKLHTAND